MDDFFPSKWLKAEDLGDDDLTVTIKSFSREHFQATAERAAEDKPAIFFNEIEKGLILNKTNFKLIVDATGEPDTDNWLGKRIALTVVDVQSFGDVVAAIRVKKAPVNRAALLERYTKLFEKAKALKVDDLEFFAISADADEATILDAGKQLRAKVEAAEAFA
jgi:hypothetical protein